MKKNIRVFIWAFCALCLLASCNTPDNVELLSPDQEYSLEFHADNPEGSSFYTLSHQGKEIVGKSGLGFILANGQTIGKNIIIKDIVRNSVDSEWVPLYGERSVIPEVYNECILSIEDKGIENFVFRIVFRAYNEGLAIRYEFPEKTVGDSLTITRELTEFNLNPEAKTWITYTSQGKYHEATIKEIEAPCERPLLVETGENSFLALGEAAGIDFARTFLEPISFGSGILVTRLGSIVTFSKPFKTPWRYIMAGNSAGALLEKSYMLLNLNDPNEIENTDWIKPGKVIRDISLTTRGSKACIDFALEHNLQYVIVSAGWYGNEFTTEADASTATLDPARSKGPLDLDEIISYGNEKGIGIMLYVNRNQLEKQLDEILPLYKDWGIKGIKYGFVRTGSQQWTGWMHEAVRKAADHQMVLSIHDDYRPVGYSRTYPNLMTQEGIRGDEESPPSEHTTITVFTRMIAGAGDNTVCYFAPRVDVMGSHAVQLAKTVCIYSPLLWLYWYDRPAASPLESGSAGGSDKIILEVPELEFFDEVPTTWDATKVLEGYPGKYAFIARKSGDSWFLGAINGVDERKFETDLDFLEPGTKYTARIYYDDPAADNPTKMTIKTTSVEKGSSLGMDVLERGGFAVIIKPEK